MRHRSAAATSDTAVSPVAVLDTPQSEPSPPAVTKSEAAVQELPTDEDRIALPARRGPSVHALGMGRRRSRLALYRQGAPTTTRQAEVLNTAMVGSPSDERGIIIGLDKLSGVMIAHDPITAYQDRRITSPNVIVVGTVGAGKSSLIKTVYVERPLLLRDRRALVVDKKPGEHGEGEYAPVSRRFGAEPFRFDPDDPDHRTTTCLNLLDPVILAGGGPAAQKQLLFAIAELAGREELDEWHHKALSLAYRATRRAVEVGDIRRPVPVIGDLVERFMDVVGDAALRQARPVVLDRLAMAAASMQFRFERLLEDELAGMFDRETSPHVTLNPKLTVFDVSALPEDGPSTSMVMVAANAWLMGMLTRHRGIRTNFVAEEGWHLLGGPGGRVIQSKSKLSRGLGLSLIAAIHHLTDIPKDSPAIAMIKEAQTVHVFRQDKKDDIDECVAYFNLEESNAAGLSNLDQGEFLLKVGTHREIGVQHVRTPAEMEFTNTDSALTNRPAVAPAEAVKLVKT